MQSTTIAIHIISETVGFAFYIKWVLFRCLLIDEMASLWSWVDLNENIMTLLWLYEYWDVHIILFTVYIVYDTVDAHFINSVRMEGTEHEVEFRKIVYVKKDIWYQ